MAAFPEVLPLLVGRLGEEDKGTVMSLELTVTPLWRGGSTPVLKDSLQDVLAAHRRKLRSNRVGMLYFSF